MGRQVINVSECWFPHIWDAFQCITGCLLHSCCICKCHIILRIIYFGYWWGICMFLDKNSNHRMLKGSFRLSPAWLIAFGSNIYHSLNNYWVYTRRYFRSLTCFGEIKQIKIPVLIQLTFSRELSDLPGAKKIQVTLGQDSKFALGVACREECLWILCCVFDSLAVTANSELLMAAQLTERVCVLLLGIGLTESERWLCQTVSELLHLYCRAVLAIHAWAW